METKKTQTDLHKNVTRSSLMQERYSALLDGELNDQELDDLLKSEDDLSDWETYGLIGDVLRSPDLALAQINLQKKEGFITSFERRLEQEALIMAPNVLRKTPRQHLSHWGAWLAASGFAVLVAVGIVYNVYDNPQQPGVQIAVGNNNQVSPSTQLHDNGGGTVMQAGYPSENETNSPLYGRPGIHVVNTVNGAVLRDSQLEPYIRAHQQFSYNPELTTPVYYTQPSAVMENRINFEKTKAVDHGNK